MPSVKNLLFGERQTSYKKNNVYAKLISVDYITTTATTLYHNYVICTITAYKKYINI